MNKVNLHYQCPLKVKDFDVSDSGEFHCNTCSKNLTDFRNQENFELNEGSCGIFNASQVNKIHRRGHLLKLGMALPLITILGITQPNLAQGQIKEKIEQTINNEIKIRGVIRDKETQASLNNVILEVIHNDIVINDTTTNMEGEFELKIDTSKYNLTDLRIRISTYCFEEKVSMPINRNQEIVLDISNEGVINMEENHKCIITGIIEFDYEPIDIQRNEFGLDTKLPDFLLNFYRD